jgi:hypothetical protein
VNQAQLRIYWLLPQDDLRDLLWRCYEQEVTPDEVLALLSETAEREEVEGE